VRHGGGRWAALAAPGGGAAGHVPEIRHAVVDVLARECPGVDLSAAALVVTELAANVVTHAYVKPGPLDVEVVCEPDAAVVTVRGWGRGFGRSIRRGMGIGLQIVAALAESFASMASSRRRSRRAWLGRDRADRGRRRRHGDARVRILTAGSRFAKIVALDRRLRQGVLSE